MKTDNTKIEVTKKVILNYIKTQKTIRLSSRWLKNISSPTVK